MRQSEYIYVHSSAKRACILKFGNPAKRCINQVPRGFRQFENFNNEIIVDVTTIVQLTFTGKTRRTEVNDFNVITVAYIWVDETTRYEYVQV